MSITATDPLGGGIVRPSQDVALRTVTTGLLAIPVVWYLTYAPIHELGHALGEPG